MRANGWAALTIALGVAACGGGSPKSAGGPTGPSGPGLTTWVSSSSPADGAKRVPMDQKIVVNFAQAVDPTSVNASTVQVIPIMTPMSMSMRMGASEGVEEIMNQIPGTISVDPAGLQLTFTPDEHLHNSMDYRVTLLGFRTSAGAALNAANIYFTTLTNPRTRRVTYQNGTLSKTHIYDVDPSTGMQTEMRVYNGTDTPANLQSRTVMMNATIPGPPQVAVSSVDYDANNAITSYNAPILENGATVAFGMYAQPGANTLWDQADDLLDAYFSMLTSHGIHMVMQRFFANNNTPALWSSDPAVRATAFTSRGVELSERDSMGRTLKQVVYSSLGANGQIDFNGTTPAPVDDVVTQYTVIERNGAGQRLKATRFGQRAGRNGTPPAIPPAGANGILFDGDDPITSLEITTRDAQGHETLEVDYNGPGLDNNWATTTDNIVDDYTMTIYNATGVRTGEKRYTAGANQLVDNGGGDDVLQSESTFDPAL